LQVADASKKTCLVAHFIAELALLDLKIWAYLRSTIAAACIYLAHVYMSLPDPWSKPLQYYLDYTLANIQPCAYDLHAIVRLAPIAKCQAICKKYSYPKYENVTLLMAALADVELP